jgi:ABC-type multidrug transport system fused ATPase/permease subunit
MTKRRISQLPSKAHPRASVNKPKVFIFSFLCFISLTRVVSLLVDPYDSRRLFPLFLGELLFSLGYWGIVSILMLVVCLWLGAFLKTKIKSKKVIQRVYKTCIALIAVWLGLTFAEALGYGYAANFFVRWGFYLGYAVLFLLFSGVISIILLHYARLFSASLKIFQSQRRRKLIQKINRFAVTVAVLILGTIVVILVVALLIFLLSWDIILYMIAITIERAVEVAFCLVTWGTYKKNLKDEGVTQESSVHNQPLSSLRNESNNIKQERNEKMTKETPKETEKETVDREVSNKEVSDKRVSSKEVSDKELSPKDEAKKEESHKEENSRKDEVSNSVSSAASRQRDNGTEVKESEQSSPQQVAQPTGKESESHSDNQQPKEFKESEQNDTDESNSDNQSK